MLQKRVWRIRGVEVYPNHEIIKINDTNKKLIVKNLETNEERTESYDKLILSVGSVPFVPNIKGKDLENVVLFGGRQFAEELRYKTVNPDVKNVVVVESGGYIGIETAQSIAKNGKNVTVIYILERPLDVYLDKELTDVLEKELRENNILFEGSQMLHKDVGENGKSGKRIGVKFDSVYVEQDTRVDYVPSEYKEKVYAKLFYNPESRVILGTQILSKYNLTANIHVVSLAIKAKMTIDDLAFADFFFQLGFNRPWEILNELALVTQKKNN